MPKTAEQSVADRLAAIGLGHRADDNTRNTGRRVIFEKATGHELGRFDVFEAIELLRARAA